MQELGFDISRALPWFPYEADMPYILVRVSAEYANSWITEMRDAIRRCYITDELLQSRSQQLEGELQGTHESRQSQIINSKLPNPGSTMAGDFGEILAYFYLSSKAHPHIAFGPKKWRLKQDGTKSVPYSDVIQFILPTWPIPSEDDELLCAEVKLKSTNGTFSPIGAAISGCLSDRTSRLSKTLQWLKARAIGESLGVVQIAHLDRFINATDHPPVTKRFYAIAVVCSSLLDGEIQNVPVQASADFTLVVVSVPSLHDVYNAVYNAVKASTPTQELEL